MKVPRGDSVRPTPERVREAWMSVLGPQLDGAHVVDLFAGTGALGLEALSRGAQHATFVERNRRVLGCLRANVEALEAEGVEADLSLTGSGLDATFGGDEVVVDLEGITFIGSVAGVIAAIAAVVLAMTQAMCISVRWPGSRGFGRWHSFRNGTTPPVVAAALGVVLV